MRNTRLVTVALEATGAMETAEAAELAPELAVMEEREQMQVKVEMVAKERQVQMVQAEVPEVRAKEDVFTIQGRPLPH